MKLTEIPPLFSKYLNFSKPSIQMLKKQTLTKPPITIKIITTYSKEMINYVKEVAVMVLNNNRTKAA